MTVDEAATRGNALARELFEKVSAEFADVELSDCEDALIGKERRAMMANVVARLLGLFLADEPNISEVAALIATCGQAFADLEVAFRTAGVDSLQARIPDPPAKQRLM